MIIKMQFLPPLDAIYSLVNAVKKLTEERGIPAAFLSGRHFFRCSLFRWQRRQKAVPPAPPDQNLLFSLTGKAFLILTGTSELTAATSCRFPGHDGRRCHCAHHSRWRNQVTCLLPHVTPPELLNLESKQVKRLSLS